MGKYLYLLSYKKWEKTSGWKDDYVHHAGRGIIEEMKRIMDTLFAGLQPVRSCEKQKSVRKQHQQER